MASAARIIAIVTSAIAVSTIAIQIQNGQIGQRNERRPAPNFALAETAIAATAAVNFANVARAANRAASPATTRTAVPARRP